MYIIYKYDFDKIFQDFYDFIFKKNSKNSIDIYINIIYYYVNIFILIK